MAINLNAPIAVSLIDELEKYDNDGGPVDLVKVTQQNGVDSQGKTVEAWTVKLELPSVKNFVSDEWTDSMWRHFLRFHDNFDRLMTEKLTRRQNPDLQQFHAALETVTTEVVRQKPELIVPTLAYADEKEAEGKEIEKTLVNRTVDYDLNESNNDTCQLKVNKLKNGDTQIVMRLIPEGDNSTYPNYWEGSGNKWIITVSPRGRVVDFQIDTTTGYADIPTNYGNPPRGIFSVAQVYEEGNARRMPENTFTGLRLANGVKKTPQEIYDRLRQILDELVKREGFEGWYWSDTPKLTSVEASILSEILQKMSPVSIADDDQATLAAEEATPPPPPPAGGTTEAAETRCLDGQVLTDMDGDGVPESCVTPPPQ